GDNDRCGRAQFAARRHLRCAFGELRQDRLFRELPRVVAVLAWRLVHLDRDGVPEWPRGHTAPRWPDATERMAAQDAEPERAGCRCRRAESSDWSRSVTMNRDLVLKVEGLSVAFDGFKAVDDLTLYVDENEIRAVI